MNLEKIGLSSLALPEPYCHQFHITITKLLPSAFFSIKFRWPNNNIVTSSIFKVMMVVNPAYVHPTLSLKVIFLVHFHKDLL